MDAGSVAAYDYPTLISFIMGEAVAQGGAQTAAAPEAAGAVAQK